MSRLEGIFRLWCCLIGASVAASAAAPAVFASPPLAQSEPVAAVDELWDEYPLDPKGADPGAAGSPPGRTGTEPGTDTGGGKPPATGVDPGPGATPVPSPAETDGGSAAVVPVLISLSALAVAMMLGTAIARRRGSTLPEDDAHAPAPARAEVTEARHRVYVEGSTAREGIGEFAGYVNATMVGDEPTNDFLCLGDPASDGALWVRRSEITSMRAPYAETLEGREAPSGRFERPTGTPSRPTRA